MISQHTYLTIQGKVRDRSKSIPTAIELEMPLLTAIAREIGQPGRHFTSLLPQAHKLLETAFDSIDRLDAAEPLDVA